MDKQIIQLLLDKNPQGMELLKKQYQSFILYILRGLRLSQLDIEECCQDVYIRLWHHIDEYDQQVCSFKNYIALITRRIGLNYIRKNETLMKEIQYEQMDIFEGLEVKQDIDWKGIVQKLSPFQQELFYRRFYYFQTIDEIAREKGKTYKSIESQLYRLKKKLREFIKEEGYYE